MKIKTAAALLLLVPALSSCHKSLEDKAAEDAEEFTRRECPRNVAENIVQDSMTFERGTKTITYYYTLQGILDNKTVLDRHKKEYDREFSKNIKRSAVMRKYVEAGFKFRYVYTSERNGSQLLELKF